MAAALAHVQPDLDTLYRCSWAAGLQELHLLLQSTAKAQARRFIEYEGLQLAELVVEVDQQKEQPQEVHQAQQQQAASLANYANA